MNKVSTKVWIILGMLMILIFAGSYLLDIPLKDVFFKSNIQEETKEISEWITETEGMAKFKFSYRVNKDDLISEVIRIVECKPVDEGITIENAKIINVTLSPNRKVANIDLEISYRNSLGQEFTYESLVILSGMQSNV